MSNWRIGPQQFHSEAQDVQQVLAHAYTQKLRPQCLCRAQGVDMYIAHVAGRYVVKRMPNTGSQHAPACDSYEPPPELSGAGQVRGSAIQEDPSAGLTLLKLDFSLTKIGGRSAPVATDKESSSVRTDGNKLTLRATLHYLWEEAGFNRWSPAMAGKRTWYTIRKYLLQAAASKMAKGSDLSKILYVPEPFKLDEKDAIASRRMATMGSIATTGKGTRRLMLVIGEVKEIAPSRYGQKIVFKHLPDCHFMLNEDLHKRLLKRFELELGLWDALEESHLVAIATFGVGPTGVASIEEVALMGVTENWIPFESSYEKLLLDAMTTAQRHFIKGMRYNLPSSVPLACVVASDTQPEPTAMYIQAAGTSDDFVQAQQTLMQDSKLATWVWKAGIEAIPALP